MLSILGEIAKLRKGQPIVIDYKNSNRYRVVVQETNGTKTGYYFSSPIYNISTNKVVDFKFRKNENCFDSYGSNTYIQITNEVFMKNPVSYCRMLLKNPVNFHSEYEIHCGKDILLKTTNGIAYKALIHDKKNITFEIELGIPFMNVISNDKCLCFMQEQFRPFMTVSCIGTASKNGEIIAPARISWNQKDDRKYTFTITPCSSMGEHVLVEMNLYEEKLLQDTTVESNNPQINNAFGSTAFIGHTIEYGEQWLYTRPDYYKMPELMGKKIRSGVLYFPKCNQSEMELSAYNIAARFCSFGSNWENKIAVDSVVADSNTTPNYHTLDVTSLFADNRTTFFKHSEGFVLKPKTKGVGFTVIPTGDSYFFPQIFEINYN